ncbi:MlaD family protein [Denitratisoma sp. agr-D3]
MENRAHALMAGFFVLLLGLAVALAAWWLSGRGEETRDYLIVSRSAVSGLNPQAQVRYRGIRAGKVADVSLDPQDPRNILILIRIDDDIPITRATQAQLQAQGLTGLAYVMLDDDGSDPTPLAGRNGEPPRILLKASTMDAVAEAARRVAAVFDEQGVARIKRTLDNVAEASEGLKEMPAILASVRQILNADTVRRAQALLGHLEKTAGEAAPLTAELRQLVVSLNQLSQRFDQIGREAGATTVPRLNRLLGELEQNSRQLNRVLEEVEESPQALLFGRNPPPPGPGEGGSK